MEEHEGVEGGGRRGEEERENQYTDMWSPVLHLTNTPKPKVQNALQNLRRKDNELEDQEVCCDIVHLTNINNYTHYISLT